MGKKINRIGICRLCGKEEELCDSHIIPKFMFKYFKNESGVPFKYHIIFTDPNKQNQKGQGGPTEKLLCKGCEAQFSGYETYANLRLLQKSYPSEINIWYN